MLASVNLTDTLVSYEKFLLHYPGYYLAKQFISISLRSAMIVQLNDEFDRIQHDYHNSQLALFYFDFYC